MARKSSDMADMFLAFTKWMEQQQGSDTEPAQKPRAKRTRSSGKVATPKSTPAATLNAERKRVTTKPKRTTPKGVITSEDAWKALGADPTYQPSDPNAPARNGQLWALNAAGKLRLS